MHQGIDKIHRQPRTKAIGQQHRCRVVVGVIQHLRQCFAQVPIDGHLRINLGAAPDGVVVATARNPVIAVVHHLT